MSVGELALRAVRRSDRDMRGDSSSCSSDWSSVASGNVCEKDRLSMSLVDDRLRGSTLLSLGVIMVLLSLSFSRLLFL